MEIDMNKKADPLTQFARGLTPAAAESLGRGFADGIKSILPEATRLLARELDRKTISVRELWRMAGMAEAHFYKMVRNGRGPRTIREGARHMVRISDAERWLKDLAESSNGKGATRASEGGSGRGFNQAHTGACSR